jgi:hypothetical protein
VGEGGAADILVGHFEATIDPKTGLATSFESGGLALDVCQLLGP